MWNTPTAETLKSLPELYETVSCPLGEKLIHLHFFIGSTNWYISEYDRNDDLFFGFCILNGDTQNAEWGYVSFSELKALKVQWVEVDNDLHWQPRMASEVDKISECLFAY